MCQSLSAGGRRCPIHQNANRAAIKVAANTSGLTIHQVERLFAELRREGRHAELPTQEQHNNSIFVIKAYADNTDNKEAIINLLNKADEDTNLDGASAYAQRLIIDKAFERANALQTRFLTIANRTGYTSSEIKQKFQEIYDSIEIRRGEEHPSEYNQNTRRHAAQANLPYDVQSVVALERLNNIEQRQVERRVELIPVSYSGLIHSYGYDEGRLEITFNNNPEQIFAYHNVSEEDWDAFRNADSPGIFYHRLFRGNDDYTYESVDEAERDAFRVRCASCGQFRAADHICPESVVRDEVVNAGTPAHEVDNVVKDAVNDSLTPARFEEIIQQAAEQSQQVITPEEIAEADAAETEEKTVTAAENNTPAYVVPLPEIEAQNSWVLDTPDENIVEDRHYPNYISATESLERKVYAATVENQSHPEVYAAKDVLLIEDKGEHLVAARTVDGGKKLGEDVILSDEQKAIIAAAPEHMKFVLAHTVDTENNKLNDLSIYRSFDSRKYTQQVRQLPGSHVGGEYHSRFGWRFYHKPTQVELQENVTEEMVQKAFADNQTLVNEGKAVRLGITATANRKYVFDANLKTQPKIKTGYAAQFKKAIKEGNAVVLPVHIYESGNNNQVGVDDQGIIISGGSLGYHHITGEVLIRRNAAGVMEIISPEQTLKCSCQDYREKYYCRHLNYAQRHIPAVAQQMVPNVTRRANDPNATPAQRLMTAALAARNDVTIVEPDKGDPYVSFGTETPNNYSRNFVREWDYNFRDRQIIPSHLLPANADYPTVEEIIELMKYKSFLDSFEAITIPRSQGAIRTALKRSDVEVPVRVDYHSRFLAVSNNGVVTGNILYNRQADGKFENASVKSHTLKCTCNDYTENYDCIHVRGTLDNHFIILGSGSRQSTEGTNSAERVIRRYYAQIREEREIYNRMSSGNRSRDEVLAALAEQRARNEILERERQERYVRAERERLEAAKEANKVTIEASAQYRENMLKRWETVDEGYTQNPETFFNDYKEALARKRKDKEPIPFRTENVTDGICADEPGARRFGIELEFDIKPGVNRRDALAKIGKELHEAGLTESSDQVGYHSARMNGWAKWSFENDCTVDAELVSPIMKDTPEDWKQLQTALEIINRNGGIATKRTGSHVHVSTASYEGSTAKQAELLRTVNQNEDILYRLASNPATGTHRGTQWCAPNVNDSLGDIDADTTGHNVGESNHNVGLNFEGVRGTDFKKSNIEFRMWDGTLDAAVIQQQIVLSAAITDAAEREVIKNGGSKKPTKNRLKIGTGKTSEVEAISKHTNFYKNHPSKADRPKPKHNADSFKDSTTDVAGFFDSIFRRKEDRAAATALFAVTNWQ